MSPRTVNDAAQQLHRLMLAIAALRDEEPHSLEELAGIVGASVELIAKDLRTLVTRSEQEVQPGAFIEGVQLAFGRDSVQLRSAHFRRPMGLTRAELAALELGLTALQHELPPPDAAQADNARQHVANAAPWVGVVERFPDAHAEAVDAEIGEHLAILREAIDARRKAHIAYRSGSANTAVERTVHPYGLVSAKGRWYLIAWCDQKQAIRIFRLDRIAASKVLEEPAVVLADVNLEEQLTHGRALVNHAEEQMVVRYSAKVARWIVEHEEVESQPDGSVIVRYPLLDDQWGVRHVLQYGPDAEVLEPARVRGMIADRLRTLVGAK